MFKKLNKMKIGARLKKSFRQIILIFGILSALVVVIMLYTINNYGTILDNYAYPQGDIAMAMNESAEVRAASRGIVGYDSDSLIESMKEQHEQAVKSFEEYLEKIRPTMITKEGTACMDAIDKAWAEYKEVDAKVIEVGATTDTAKSLQAQQMMTDEAAPKYQALDDALQKLMALNISLGNAKRAQLRTVMIAALTIIIIVIAVSTIYSNSLSVAISKSIEKPLNELKDRFITFAEGDIDSPLPTVESEDEIKELVSGVSAMSDRIRVIIKDSGRMLNEMSEGNFAIDTECEEVYTGAFTDLLTGIRKMNEEIDTTVRGVDDASGQVLTGSTNLAEAAQSLAEGATDQAASVEEMQATINELTGGMDVAYKNLIYQLYSMDLSRKVKSARRTRNLSGEYTASFVCYGYKKDPDDKHKLIIDEEAAKVVVEIFSLIIAGYNASEVARILNERKIPTRVQNQWKNGINYVPVHNKGDYMWDNSEVIAIVQNEQYKGIMIQNKCETVGFGDNKKVRKRNKED